MKMTWDSAWERIFRSREWGKYPPEEVIRFIARNFYGVEPRNSVNILDIGCGTGAGSWYVAREGFRIYGIDGSETAIKLAKKRFGNENLTGDFKIGDITSLPYPDEFFDGVIDLAAMECNRINDIKKIISEVYRVLKPGGKFFSMLIKVNSYGYGLGKKIENNTFTNIREGPHKDQGVIHFSSKEELNDFFKKFKNVEIEYSERSVDNRRYLISHWIVSGEK
ncbi:MAG: class I SAM-dependent methyltransferase [Candidatus Aenigmatarchaeota archaeon]|nr:MAG: class I SAM-dependent methyltransferase [Candidatus Aenigmarchaeota archaeon]